MAWVKSHQEIRQHPKTRRLARLLGISVPQAVGHLHLLWWWAVDYAGDGDLSDYDGYDIADAAMWEADADAFVAALVTAGYIDRRDNGTLFLHDWSDYQGNFIEKREKAAERKRKSRASHTNVTRDMSVTGEGHDVLDKELELDKTREEHNNNNSYTRAREGDSESEIRLPDPKVASLYESYFGQLANAYLLEDLQQYITEDGMALEVIEQAFRRARELNEGFRYAKGILRAWRQKGIRTLAGAAEEAAEFERRRGDGLRGEDRVDSRARASPAPPPTAGQAYRQLRLARQHDTSG